MTSFEQTLRELALEALALSHKHLATAERYAELCDALEHSADNLYADQQDAAVLLQDGPVSACRSCRSAAQNSRPERRPPWPTST